MKTITKEQLKEFKAIAVAAERLKNRIEKLYHETDNMNFHLNYNSISFFSRKLSDLLDNDFDSYIKK